MSQTRNVKTTGTVTGMFLFLSLLLTLSGCRSVPDESHAESLCRRAESFVARGEHDEALINLEKALALEPDHAEAYRCRGEIRQLQERYEDALNDFTRAIELAPGDPRSYCGRARTSFVIEDWAKSVADLDNAIELDPRMAAFYVYRGNVRMRQSKVQQTVRPSGLADPGQTIPEVDLAILEQASLDFDKACDLDPKNVDPHFARGLIAYAREEWSEAVDAFTEVIEINPRHPCALQARIYTWDRMGEKAKCEAELERISAPGFLSAAELGLCLFEPEIGFDRIVWTK